MIITGAFFAREASVAEGGLSATGAVWDYYMLSPHGEFHGMTLVVLLQAIPEQSRHQSVQVEIYGSAGELEFSQSREFTLTAWGDNHYRIFRLTGNATPGPTSVVISSGGNENKLTLPLRFRAFDPLHPHVIAARSAERREVRSPRWFRRRRPRHSPMTMDE